MIIQPTSIQRLEMEATGRVDVQEDVHLDCHRGWRWTTARDSWRAPDCDVADALLTHIVRLEEEKADLETRLGLQVALQRSLEAEVIIQALDSQAAFTAASNGFSDHE